jgi:phosphoribosylformylglycinamidine synthase PurS subunit
MKIEIQVLPKKGILDPQGKAVHHALENLGYSGFSEVRIGKLIQIEVKESNLPVTPATIKEMCEKLLANTVVEDYTFKMI